MFMTYVNYNINILELNKQKVKELNIKISQNFYIFYCNLVRKIVFYSIYCLLFAGNNRENLCHFCGHMISLILIERENHFALIF